VEVQERATAFGARESSMDGTCGMFGMIGTTGAVEVVGAAAARPGWAWNDIDQGDVAI
jgi:hypothetical protein